MCVNQVSREDRTSRVPFQFFSDSWNKVEPGGTSWNTRNAAEDRGWRMAKGKMSAPTPHYPTQSDTIRHTLAKVWARTRPTTQWAVPSHGRQESRTVRAKKFYFFNAFIRDKPRQAATSRDKGGRKARCPMLDTRCSENPPIQHQGSCIQHPEPASDSNVKERRIRRSLGRGGPPPSPSGDGGFSPADVSAVAVAEVDRTSTEAGSSAVALSEGGSALSTARIAAPRILSSTFYQHFCNGN